MISLTFSPILLKIFSGRERGDSGGGVGGPDSPHPTSQAKIVNNASVPSCARMLPPYVVQSSKQHPYVKRNSYLWRHKNSFAKHIQRNLKPLQKRNIITETTLYHLFRKRPRTPNMAKHANAVFGSRIWASQIWLSGVSLKRSCKMHFRHIDLVSIVKSD